MSSLGCVKGCSKHVSSVVAAAKYCSLTPCRFHPFSKHPSLHTFTRTEQNVRMTKTVCQLVPRNQREGGGAQPNFFCSLTRSCIYLEPFSAYRGLARALLFFTLKPSKLQKRPEKPCKGHSTQNLEWCPPRDATLHKPTAHFFSSLCHVNFGAVIMPEFSHRSKDEQWNIQFQPTSNSQMFLLLQVDSNEKQ